MNDLRIIQNFFEPKKILDIGANHGQFYNDIKKIFPNAYYLLVEGNEHCERQLQTMNVDYKIALLSDKIKKVKFFIRKEEPTCTGNSIYREKSSFYEDDNDVIVEEKETSTLYNILGESYFDLIKIDVQGSEIDIIKGGLEIIKKAKGVLMEVSLEEFNQGSPTSEYVVPFMKDLGFLEHYVLNNLNHPVYHTLIQQDILFINSNF
jgi:FkbM family methyltransferase